MPELPEVEQVVVALHSELTGRRIVSGRVTLARLLPGSTTAGFARKIRGARIQSVSRRGKYIVFSLDRDLVLLSHLRMTGNFSIHAQNSPFPRFAHASFALDDGRSLVYSDQRQFGILKLARGDASEEFLSRLAPEPFSGDFSPAYLATLLASSRRSVKEVIMDQTKVSGLGNIYASEALFVAGCNPFIPAREVPARRIIRLHAAILQVLSEAIAHGRSREADPGDIGNSYFNGSEPGGWRVYDREGEPCIKCRRRIVRITHRNRSVYFCPRCQKAPASRV